MSPAPCPSSAVASSAPSASSAPRADEANAKIVTFDCAKSEPPAARQRVGCGPGATPELESGIRGWNSGGPEGSVFNADELTCRAVVDLPCSGELELSIKVGRDELAHAKLTPAPGVLGCAFPLPKKRWLAALDRSAAQPFRTGIFRVDAWLVCQDPPAVLRADDDFVAGFAWGE